MAEIRLFIPDPFELFHALFELLHSLLGNVVVVLQDIFSFNIASIRINHGDCSVHRAGSAVNSIVCSSKGLVVHGKLSWDDRQLRVTTVI